MRKISDCQIGKDTILLYKVNIKIEALSIVQNYTHD